MPLGDDTKFVSLRYSSTAFGLRRSSDDRRRLMMISPDLKRQLSTTNVQIGININYCLKIRQCNADQTSYRHQFCKYAYWHWRIHTYTRLTTLFPGLPRWAGTRKVKPIWILLKQETVSGSGISWDICKSATHSRQITTPASHTHFLQAGCASCRPTNSVNALKAQVYYQLVNIDFSIYESN